MLSSCKNCREWLCWSLSGENLRRLRFGMARSAAQFISLLAFIILGCAIAINAQTVTANTCSVADVQAAVDAAPSGGTVSVPTGTCTWSSAVTVTRAIHMQGAGVGNTIITGQLTYLPASGEASKTFELNGFSFLNNQYHFAAFGSPSAPIMNLIVHDNAFTGATTRAIYLTGMEFGVFYKNTFSGNYISVSVIGCGAGTYAPGTCEEYPHAFGSASYPYFEDNTFGNGTGAFVSETGQGGRLVMRHNTITGYACSGCEVFDLHGDQGTGAGTVSEEIYHNSVDVGTAGTIRWAHHRGGQAIIANNTISRSVAFNLSEYRSWGGNGFCAPYPAPGQINNTTEGIGPAFYFDNVAGGAQQVPTFSNGGTNGGICGSDPPWGENQYLQLNRDYFLPQYGPAAALPSTCTADGTTYYGTTDTDVIYKCTSTNTWTQFYVPYTYPHPLRGSGQVIAPPTNLSVTVQ